MEHRVLVNELQKACNMCKDQFKLPSISASVYAEGEEIHIASGYADTNAGIRAGKDTVYSIGSTSKAFAATMLYILQEDGLLNIDEPIKNYLPFFEMYDEYSTKHLTIRDALCHRSGLSRHDISIFNRPDASMKDIVRSIKFLEPSFPLRYRMHYQNHMYVLATLLVEEIAGVTWQSFIKDKIFTPLNMNNSYGYGDMVPEGGKKAKPYRLTGANIEQLPYNYAKNMGCCGSIYSSTADMLKWAEFNMTGHKNILAQKSLDDIHYPQMVIKPGEFSDISFGEIDDTSYCLGWFSERYRGEKLIKHTGSIGGFKAFCGYLPNKKVALSVLTNLDGTNGAMALANTICDICLGLDRLNWYEKYSVETERTIQESKKIMAQLKNQFDTATTIPWDIEKYNGIYSNPAYGNIELSTSGDKVIMSFAGETGEIRNTENNKFVVKNPQIGYFEFWIDIDAKPSSINMRFEKTVVKPIQFLKI